MPRAESKRKRRKSETDAGDIPETLSAAGLSGLVDDPQASIRDILMRSGLQSIAGKFNTRAALRTLAKAWKERAGRVDAEIAIERREQARSERERSQIETGKAKSEVRLASDVDSLWMDWLAQAASTIESAEYIPQEKRIKLSGEIASIRVNDSRVKSRAAR